MSSYYMCLGQPKHIVTAGQGYCTWE